MSARKKEVVATVPVKAGRPANYQEWAFQRMRRRKVGKKEIEGASSRVLHRPPKYLRLAPMCEDGYDWVENARVAGSELKRLRDKGLITCTDGWWWRRRQAKLKAVK